MRLIDADALIDKYGEWYTEEGTEVGYIGTIKGIVDSMPTIEPERKRGRWIYKNDLKQFFCSECGFPSLTYDDTYIYGMDLPNYCEDCGADMRTRETDCDYERTVEQLEHDMLYEPTFNPDDGSM